MEKQVFFRRQPFWILQKVVEASTSQVASIKIMKLYGIKFICAKYHAFVKQWKCMAFSDIKSAH